MHVFQPAPDRIFVIMAAGNLGTTQAVLNRIRRHLDDHHAGLEPEPLAESSRKGDRKPSGTGDAPPNLVKARYLFEVADYIGSLSVAVQRNYAHSLREAGATGGASFILGGQIAGQPHGLYLIYPQGNAIMATRETPYLQIGETKYGKPPLDNVGHTNLSLEDAARLCLISEVLTQRSNLTVGPPFELAILPADALAMSHQLTLGAEAPELAAMVETWSDAQREALHRMPSFPWEQASPT
jgi:putative proteasome-type protease